MPRRITRRSSTSIPTPSRKARAGQYPEWVGEYADVAGRTGGNASASANDTDPADRALAFERARENQTAFAADIREFRATRAAYERARERGRTTRARELARRLEALATSANDRSTAFARNYRIASGDAPANETAIAAVESTSANVSQTAGAIESATFTNTTLRVGDRSERVSFSDPLVVSGLLGTENGTVLANRPVTFEIGDRTIETTTDAYGGFTVRYRPMSLPLDRQSLEIEYVPENDSVYREASATIPVDPEAVEPTITTETQPSTVSYGDRITVSGSVRADGRPIEDVPVLVRVAGEPIAANRTGGSSTDSLAGSTVETNADGEYSLSTTLPADLAAGDVALNATIPWQGRAIASANASAPLTVESTATALTARAGQVDGRTVRVTGRLRTENGHSIGEREVLLRAGGAALGTVETTSNGTYATTVTIPTRQLTQQGGAPTTSLTISYAGRETSLEPAHETATVALDGLSISERASIATSTVFGTARDALGAVVPQAVLDALSAPSWTTVLLGALALALGWGLVRGSRSLRRRGEDGTATEVSEDAGGVEEPARSGTEHADPGRFDPADWLLAGDPDRAVQAGYAVVRSRVGRELGVDRGMTHREFYRACRDASIGETRLAALGALTDAYERAAFASESLSERVAGEVLDRLEAFGEGEDELESAEPAVNVADGSTADATGSDGEAEMDGESAPDSSEGDR
ncbi:hypothetical protein BRC86_07905 [Halobacteriales archaeon QS_3_64_16]|nr:MAG: hypothetical protein BRC86_07905 [Halobacteriales archaeon QS_3_64_16]